VALTLNSGVGTPFGDLRMVRIGTAALRCARSASSARWRGTFGGLTIAVGQSANLPAMTFLRLSLLLAATLVLGAVHAHADELSCSVPPRSDERLNGMTDDGIGLTSDLGLADGRYALPRPLRPPSSS
jgi:hypothetical protein